MPMLKRSAVALLVLALAGPVAHAADGNRNNQAQQAQMPSQTSGPAKNVQNGQPTNPPGPTGKAVIFNPGWGCHVCGYSNGTSLSGLTFGATDDVSRITLPDGRVLELR